MQNIVVLTSSGGDPSSVLPAFALLSMHADMAPLTTPALSANLDADLLILDGRRDLVSARALCRTALDVIDPPPLLLVLDEGGFAVVSASWGASDVVLANASPAEIQARIRMLVDHHRAQQALKAPKAAPAEPSALSIDINAYTAHLEGELLDLTYKEFELLRHLVDNPRQVFSRDQLLSEVWGYDYFGGARTVDVHVRRLRAKLGPKYEAMIATVRNVGYRFDPS